MDAEARTAIVDALQNAAIDITTTMSDDVLHHYWHVMTESLMRNVQRFVETPKNTQRIAEQIEDDMVILDVIAHEAMARRHEN